MWTMNFQMFKLDLEKAEEWEMKLPTPVGSSEKQESPRKDIFFFFFFLNTSAYDSVDDHKLWKILQEMGIPDHLTCLLKNLNAGQEATVRTAHGTTDWFQIRKEVCQGCILSPYLLNLFTEYIMWNARLDEAQAGSNIAGGNINNLRYSEDTTLLAKSKEELMIHLLKVKE